jgi:glycosyltransferase involved in cell wall biosynthesis
MMRGPVVRILYLAYTGLLEPLGQSQVLGYLRLLSRSHEITLVTFEKPGDLADGAAMASQRAECEALSIRWIALRYHHRPRLLATAWDLTVFVWTALWEARRGETALLHCRGYIPSFVGLCVKWLAGRPFIFDMRALWPEEMVAAGRLTQGSLMFRALKAGEGLCLRRAAAVVSLTQAAIAYLRGLHGARLDAVTFSVIPTCVDLEMFRPRNDHRDGGPRGSRPLALGSIGTILSGWFKLDWLAAFFRAADALCPGTVFRVVTPEDRARTAALLSAGGAPSARLDILGVARHEVPGQIAALDAVAMFFTPGVAKLGSCPTRMGEVLACGVPVVVNSGVGDVEAIVRHYGVGVVVDDDDTATLRAAAAELAELLRDPGVADRCRRAAEDYFSLDKGVAQYDELYRASAGTPSGA